MLEIHEVGQRVRGEMNASCGNGTDWIRSKYSALLFCAAMNL